MKILDNTILQEITERLVAEFDPDQVILFGSHAWGTPNENSDIDLYVVIPNTPERPLARARRALSCLEKLQVSKDVLVRTRLEAQKYQAVYASLESLIFEKGRKLYERH